MTYNLTIHAILYRSRPKRMKKNGTLLSKTDIVLQKNNGEFKFSHFMCVDNFEGFDSFVKV